MSRRQSNMPAASNECRRRSYLDNAGGLQTAQGERLVDASLNVIGIAPFDRYRQPARWYFPPLFVTYTVCVTSAVAVPRADRASGAAPASAPAVMADVTGAGTTFVRGGLVAASEHGGTPSLPAMHKQCGWK
jgi:hypothetical protein